MAGGRAKLGIAVWHYLGPLSPSLANPMFHYPASGVQYELAASTAGAAAFQRTLVRYQPIFSFPLTPICG